MSLLYLRRRSAWGSCLRSRRPWRSGLGCRWWRSPAGRWRPPRWGTPGASSSRTCSTRCQAGRRWSPASPWGKDNEVNIRTNMRYHHLNLFVCPRFVFVFSSPPVLASFLCCLVITLSMCLLCLCVYFIFCVSFALRLFLLFEFALCFNIFVSQYSCVLASLCFNTLCFNILVFWYLCIFFFSSLRCCQRI